MICDYCRAAADLPEDDADFTLALRWPILAVYRIDGKLMIALSDGQGRVEQRDTVISARDYLHGECAGCTCQHWKTARR